MTFLVRLEPATAAEPIGGKARSLLRLAAAGQPVPAAVVVTGRLFERWRAAGPPVPARLDEPGALAALERAAAAMAAAPPPPDFETALRAALAELAPDRAARFAVRSSAEIEDRPGALAAGVFLSRTDVPASGVAAAVREVAASALSPGAVAYVARRGVDPRALGMAVLVHPFLAGDSAGTAAWDPAAQPAPLVEPSAGARRPTPGARAAVVAAARALAAAEGAVELEWVSAGDAVTLLQLRPYQAPRAASWPGAAELAALPGGPWRWDAVHNPFPLSPAQAGLVAHADTHCQTPFRQHVISGYLFVSDTDQIPPLPARRGEGGDEGRGPNPEAELRTLLNATEARLASPPAALDGALDLFAATYEPLFARVQPAAAAARQALAELLRERGPRAIALLPALLAGVCSRAAERAARAAAIARARGEAARQRAIEAYLALFGDEAPVWDVAVPTYAEDPRPLRRLAGAAPRQATSGLAAAAAAEAEGTALMPAGARRTWKARLAAARAAAAVAEDDDALYARVQAVVRRALLREGERLRAAGVIARADDAFWLPLEAVRRHARGEQPLAAPDAARAVAGARRADAEARAHPPPLGVPAGADGFVRGQPASPGRAIGRVWLHPRPDATPAADAVVVARTLLPTELPLLGAAALVVETGGVLGHIAAQARERGIPAVVGAAGACAAFSDGDQVIVDGETGVVARIAR